MSLWNGSWIAALLVGCAGLGPDHLVRRRLPAPPRRDGLPGPGPVQPAARDPLHGRPADDGRRAVLLHGARRGGDRRRSAKPDVTINVVGKQWAWDFNYVNDDQRLRGRRAGAADGPARRRDSSCRRSTCRSAGGSQFELTSRDVVHSFWIPAFLYKMDVIPGVRNKFQVVPHAGGDLQRQVRRALRRVPLRDALQRQGGLAGASTTQHIAAAARPRVRSAQLDSNLGRSQTPPGAGAVPGGTDTRGVNGVDGTGSK